MRQIVLDTETTGLSPLEGHRVIEIGALELVGRRLTGRNFHFYLNPGREVEQEALAVHGISNEFLRDKPAFADVAAELIEFIQGAELIIHNAEFDVGFLNHELSELQPNPFGVLTDHCSVLDTLTMARKKHPGQRNSLDALRKRYDISHLHRRYHGALLDAEILAHLYLAMTGGQEALLFEEAGQAHSSEEVTPVRVKSGVKLAVIAANADELKAHAQYLAYLAETSGKAVWEN